MRATLKSLMVLLAMTTSLVVASGPAQAAPIPTPPAGVTKGSLSATRPACVQPVAGYPLWRCTSRVTMPIYTYAWHPAHDGRIYVSWSIKDNGASKGGVALYCSGAGITSCQRSPGYYEAVWTDWDISSTDGPEICVRFTGAAWYLVDTNQTRGRVYSEDNDCITPTSWGEA